MRYIVVAASPCSMRYVREGNHSTLTKSAAYPSADVSREKTDIAWTKSFVPSKRVVISTTQAASRSRSSIRLCGRWQWNSRTGEADCRS